MAKKENIKVSKDDKLWLNAVYQLIQNNKRPTYRNLRGTLYKQLHKDYNPENIDRRLARYKGTEITLQGFDYLKPELKIIDKANTVIETVRDLLLENPDKEIINTAEIVKKSGLDERETALILRLIQPYGKFWNGASGSSDFQYGFSSINTQQSDETFDQYLNFKDIRPLMEKYYSKLISEQPTVTDEYNSDEFASEEEVTLRPIFKSKINRIDPKLCFVLMPFKESWSDEIYNLIKTTIESLGLQCLRADNLDGPIIIEDIWTKINQAGFIIADLTNKNPNVMYEVGIAHTVGRPTILLTQNIEGIPFDFLHLRHIEYRNTVSGADALREKLKKLIESISKTNEESSRPKKVPINIIFNGRKLKSP